MRGVSLLIAYLLALGAIISFGIAGLMALQSPAKPDAIRTSNCGRTASRARCKAGQANNAKGRAVQSEAQDGESNSQGNGKSTDPFLGS